MAKLASNLTRKKKTLPETITYRTAALGDAAGIARLSGQLGYPATMDEIRDRLEALLGLPGCQVFVAVSGAGTVAGWAYVAHMRYLMEPDFAELIGLVVDEDLRSQGIGGQLIRLAEDWARENGLGSVRLLSAVNRHDAHRFYLAHGYTVLRDERIFVKQLRTQGD